MSDKPHVCVITTVHTPYDGRILFKECSSLATRYDVTLLCLSDTEPDELNGVRIEPMSKPSGRLARVFAGRRMVKAAVAEKADIYHFHDPEFLFQAQRLAKKTGKPVVYDVHENYPITFDQKNYIPKLVRGLAAKVVDRLERSVSPKLAGVIVADEDLVERFVPILAKAKGPRPPEGPVLVKNYPPLQALPALDFARPRKPWVVHVGVTSLVRGADTLLEAFALVHKQAPDARLVLIGDMRLDRNQLGSFIERYGLTRAVDERGFLPYSEAMEIVARCSVGVSPMPHHEKFRRNLASKIFDYMGSGTPYIGSDWGAIAGTVEGEGGVLVDTEDPKAVADAMLTYLRDDELVRTTGRAGRRAVQREFNWGTQETKLFDLYEKLLARRQA